MQRYVASKAQNVTTAGNHKRDSELRNANSKQIQTAAITRKIQVSGKPYEPVVWKINPATLVKRTRPKATAAGVAGPDLRCSSSAAQIARTRWKNGSQRKLQRNRPVVGIMQSASTTKSKISSHLICLTSSLPCHRRPAISAAGATNPQANSAAVCGRLR